VVKPEIPAAPSASRSPAKATSQKTTRPSANEPPVKRSSAEAPAVSPALNSAYIALTQGDYTVAKHQYQIVLQDDPLNLDANLGLATVAASTGDLSAAQRFYRTALEIDPKNSVAHAGLAAIQMNQNAQGSENQLKAQIASEPQQAPTYSTLGHVYVTQGKWGEAQQAFFEAYRLDPTNPDHAFNLAVSLDRLGQRKLAREYYGKALSHAASRPPGFSTAEAANRMNQLGTANE
jgi:Tfp pilus assembly protein PilF